MQDKRTTTKSPPNPGGSSSGTLLYLYAILPQGSPAERLLDNASIAGVHPSGRLFGLRSAGMIGAVSEVPAEIFREDALNALLQDVSEVGPYAMRHNEAIRALLPGAPALIPLSFGTVYVTADGVKDLLQSNVSAFQETLKALHGKREWTVKVFLDSQAMIDAAATTSDEVRRLDAEASASAPGRAYMLRKRREEVLATETSRLQQETLNTILSGVKQAVAAVQLDDLPPQEPSGRQLAMKLSVLVAVDRLDAFNATVASLQDAYGVTGIHHEVTGPWPAYSFVGGSRDRS